MYIPSWTNQAALIEKNMQNAFLAMSYNCHSIGDCRYVFSHIPDAVFNCVIETKINQQNIKHIIETIARDYEKNHLSHCWWVSNRSEPLDIAEHLLHAGYQVGPSYNGMHLNLQNKHLELHEAPKNIRIENVNKSNNFSLWIKPIQECFGLSDKSASAFLECFKNMHEKNSKIINFLAYYNEMPAGSASLLIDDQAAGLYNGAVLPEFRKLGIMSYLGKYMMATAKNMGRNDIVLQANEQIKAQCERIGFKEYINFTAYISPVQTQP